MSAPLGSSGEARFWIVVDGAPSELVDGRRIAAQQWPGPEPASDGSVAVVERHPRQPDVLGIKNRTAVPWNATLPEGTEKEVAPDRSLKLVAGTRIRAGTTECTLIGTVGEQSGSPDDAVLRVGPREFRLIAGAALTDDVLLAAADAKGELAAYVDRHPQHPEILGLRNASRLAWTIRTPDGEERTVEPGGTVKVAENVQFLWPIGTARIVAPQAAAAATAAAKVTPAPAAGTAKPTPAPPPAAAANPMPGLARPAASPAPAPAARPAPAPAATGRGRLGDLVEKARATLAGAAQRLPARLRPAGNGRLSRRGMAFAAAGAAACLVVGVVAWRTWSSYADTPQIATAVIGPGGGKIEHPSGVRVEFPAGALDKDTNITVATTRTTSHTTPGVKLRSPVVNLTADPEPEKGFKEPVLVSIPIEGDARPDTTALTYHKAAWVPVNGWFKDGKITFPTTHFSEYAAGDKKYEIRILHPEPDPEGSPPPAREVPQGSIVPFIVEWKFDSGLGYHGKAIGSFHKGESSEVDPSIWFGSDPMDIQTFKPGPGEGTIGQESGMSTVTFNILVPDAAEPGPRTFRIQAQRSDGSQYDFRIAMAIDVVRKKVIVLDIDGLRPDIFDSALNGVESEQYPNLAKIFGGRKDRREFMPNWETRVERLIAAERYDHGFCVQNATTIFPSYTFGGHAAIFTGNPPRLHGLPGNEWLDRDPNPGHPIRKYAFTGQYLSDSMVTGRFSGGDAIASFGAPGLANSVLKCDTVYDDAAALNLQSLIGFNMYFGTSEKAFRAYAGKLEQIKYKYSSIPLPLDLNPMSKSAKNYDAEMINEVLQALRWKGGIRTVGCKGPDNLDWRDVGITTLYWGSLDHSGHGHVHGDTWLSQHTALKWVDAQLGNFLVEVRRRGVSFENSLWVLTADHGQSDLGELLKPDLRDEMLPSDFEGDPGYRVAGNWEKVYLDGKLIKELPRSLDDSDCAVAYNTGLAHIYLRAPGADWTVAPSAGQVRRMARRIQEYCAGNNVWAFEPGRIGNPSRIPENWVQAQNRCALDLILIRPGGFGTPYLVLDPLGDASTPPMPLEEYLKLPYPQCQFYDKNSPVDMNGTAVIRYGWGPEDARFLEEAIEGMNCKRSGDVVLMPKCPNYYFESATDEGGHGALTRDHMSIPLAVAIPGLTTSEDEDKPDRIQMILANSIDMKGKPRPGNRDVRRIIINYFNQKLKLPNLTSEPVAPSGGGARRSATID